MKPTIDVNNYYVVESLIKWNGSVYSAQWLRLMFIGLFKVILESKSRLPFPEFSGYHCMFGIYLWYILKGFFNFPNVQIPKQLPKSVLAAALVLKSVLAAALGPRVHHSHSARSHWSLQLLRGPNQCFGNLSLRKLQIEIWEVATWVSVPWKVTLGKIQFGKWQKPTDWSLLELVTII